MIIDFHSHILPKVDHGSDSAKTTELQLKYASTAHVDTIVATSHFYPHRHSVSQFLERRAIAEEMLSDTNKYGIKIIFGAEILLCENIHKLPMLDELAINGTKTLLIELPFSSIDHKHTSAVESLIDNGYNVILAHPERYNADKIEEMISLGAHLQLNASSVSKTFASKHVNDWVSRGLVHGIGSDIHMNDKKAYKQFSKALAKLKNNSDYIMKKAESICFKQLS